MYGFIIIEIRYNVIISYTSIFSIGQYGTLKALVKKYSKLSNESEAFASDS